MHVCCFVSAEAKPTAEVSSLSAQNYTKIEHGVGTCSSSFIRYKHGHPSKSRMYWLVVNLIASMYISSQHFVECQTHILHHCLERLNICAILLVSDCVLWQLWHLDIDTEMGPVDYDLKYMRC